MSLVSRLVEKKRKMVTGTILRFVIIVKYC